MEQPEGQQVEPEYLTVEEAGIKASFSRHTIYKWIESGHIGKAEGLRRVGRNRRIHWPTFKKWIDKN